MKKKNIFLLVLDGLRPDRMSCYGYSRKTTPFIDSLAEQGLLFLNGYTVNHSSLPAHISLFTGIHPYFHRAASNHSYFNNKVPFLTKILKDNDYKTIGISTVNPYLSVECGFIRYFDKYIKVVKSNKARNIRIKKLVKGQNERSYKQKALFSFIKNKCYGNMRHYIFRKMADFYLRNDLGGKKIVELIKEQFDLNYHNDKPFFLFANILDTHTPFLPPEGFRDYFGSGVITKNILDAFFNGHLFQAGRIKFSSEEQEMLDVLYDGGVRYVDNLAEGLFGYLEKKGYLDDTLVIIMSDHGEMLNEHDRLIGHGDSTYEGMVRIPLIILDKTQIKKSNRREGLVSLIDIFPTILNTAGARIDTIKFKYKCKNLLEDSRPSQFVICECTALPYPDRLYNYPEVIAASYHVERTIIGKSYKFVWRSNGNHALYDLSVDRAEKYNLFEEHKNTIAKELMHNMISWYREQLNDKDFFSLEHFDYQTLRGAGSFRPKDLLITQDENNIELVQYIIR